MTTRVFGCGDDLIEFDGDIYGEVGCYGTDEDAHGVLIVFSDGTMLDVKYGDRGIWKIDVLRKGELFDRIQVCIDEDADPYSDQVFFRDGLKWAYEAREWARVK